MFKYRKIKQLSIKKHQNGFSIIELMVVVGIISLITLGLVTLFSGGVRSYISGDSQLEAQRNARQAMDYMVRELRLSERVIISQEHKVKASIPDLTGTGGPGYHVEYSWSGNLHDPVKRHMSPGGTNILIDNVLNLKFDYPKASRINILLEIDVDHDEHADISLHTAVNLRNY